MTGLCFVADFELVDVFGKDAGIEPRIWMEDVLTKIPYYLRDGKDLSELLPRRWAELGTNRTDSDSLVPNRD
ncbi:MAG: transposase domain-containing protein [Bacteroidales bacterium]|nr:transposase domain-containing protein [Bacteroidales bacterium]